MARFSTLCAAILMFAVSSFFPQPTDASETTSAPALSPADIAGAAAAVYRRENHGIIGYTRHLIQQTTAPGNNSRDESTAAFVWRDGVFANLKYVDVVSDGKPLTQADVEKRNTAAIDAWSSGKAMFREPFEPGHLDDYTYAFSTETGACPANAAAIQFASKLRDAYHGDGTMCIENATQHVLSLTFVPAALPQHADTAKITETLAEALPGVWHVVRIKANYSGHVLFIHGSHVELHEFKNFARFDTAEEALGSLASDKP